MKPILYDKSKTTFTNDYIGILTDAISCVVEEERNDQYELEMTYPVNGKFYESIEQDAIIKARPNNQDAPQPFRIYKITKMINGTIIVNARHIVYDLSKVTVAPFESTGTIDDAIQGMMDHSYPSCGFIFESNKGTAGNYKVSVPSSFRSLMGGTRGSLLDVYGTAEYHYDGYNITLNLQRGADRGVVIRYGISMIDLKQEEECEKVYTAVYPFWRSGNMYVQLDTKIISVDGQFPFSRIMTLDLTEEFEKKPTQAQLRAKAEQYINEKDIGVPSVSLDVDFSGTEDEQNINLCDTVTVEFEKYGVSTTAKCVGLTYDSLNERVTSVKLGNYKHKFIDTVTDQMKGITDIATITPTDIERTIRSITDNENGYVLLHSSTNTAHVDEILLLIGTDNLQTVQKLWRWNSGGLGYSSNGYNGPYTTAINMLGQIVATMVKTGTLSAIEIIAGTNNTFHVTTDGQITAKSGYIGSTSDGFLISANEIKNSYVRLHTDGFGVRRATGSDIGFVGKTSMQQSTNIYDIYPWNAPTYRVINPGMGWFKRTTGDFLTFGYYDETAGTNYSVIKWPVNLQVTDSSGQTRDIPCVIFYKEVNMNGHGFFGTIHQTRELARIRSLDIWREAGTSISGAYLQMKDASCGFNQCGLLNWTSQSHGVPKDVYGIIRAI